MKLPEIKYTFDDATIISYEKESINSFSLSIELSRTYYPKEGVVKLLFLGVYNVDTVNKFLSDIEQFLEDSNYNSRGISLNSILYASKHKSKSEDLHIIICQVS